MKSNHFPYRQQLALLVLLVWAASSGLLITAAPPTMQTQLTNEEFWKLSSSLSEVDGEFRSDDLLSNELGFQYVIPELLQTAQQGRVYMGVGPEQNFTYIAALKPSNSVLVDIRHGNLDVHLLYKALFELSANRAEFVSKLFSRPDEPASRPDNRQGVVHLHLESRTEQGTVRREFKSDPRPLEE